jgi:predicted transport protein
LALAARGSSARSVRDAGATSLNAARPTKPQETDMRQAGDISCSRTITDRIGLLPSSLKDCLEAVTDYVGKLGSDVEIHKLKTRLAFKKINRDVAHVVGRRDKINFAHVEVSRDNISDKILIFVRLERSVRDGPGFTRSSGFKSAYPEGEVEITIRERSDVERAKALLQRAYAET